MVQEHRPAVVNMDSTRNIPGTRGGQPFLRVTNPSKGLPSRMPRCAAGVYFRSRSLFADWAMTTPTLDLFAALQAVLEPQYRLERELGRGGMGVVFLATDTTLDRRVAIKAVHPELAAHPVHRPPVPGRSPHHRPAAAPQHRRGPHRRKRRRPALLRDGRGRRREPPAAARPRAAAGPGHGPPHRGRPGRGARRGRPGRGGAPGREAGERAARPGHRARPAGRLRHRARDGRARAAPAAPARAWRSARRPT